MNKRVLFLGITLLLIFNNISPAASKTFFAARPIISDNTLEKTMTLNRNHLIKSPGDFKTDILFLYEEAVNQGSLKKFFFPSNKAVLSVKDVNAPNTPDISADWLNISSLNDSFQSKIKIRPEYKQFGALLKLNKQINCFHKKLWINAMLPFVEVQTNAKFMEYDKQNEKTTPGITSEMHNATEAFNNPSWKYGKIKNGNQKLAGLADIDFKLGYDLFQKPSTLISVFGSLIFPTGYKPKAEYLLEPRIGNGNHFALGGGLQANLKILNRNKSSLYFVGNVDYHYLLKSRELRSFDLKENGDWSRYLLIIERNNPLDQTTNIIAKPGINYFTKELCITPGSTLNLLTSLHYKHSSFNFELGYNFWWKDSEKGSLKDPWSEGIGIASNTASNTQHDAKISEPRKEDLTEGFVTINQEDLNLNSAKQTSTASHKIVLCANIEGKWKKHPIGLDIGNNYEFAVNNNALSKWGIFLQMHIAI